MKNIMLRLKKFIKNPSVNILLTLIWIAGMTIGSFVLAKEHGFNPGISGMLGMMTAIMIRFPTSPYRKYY